MEMTKVKRIIAKVRKMYQYAPNLMNCVRNKASVHFEEDGDCELYLDYIEIGMYDKLIVSSKCITLVPEHGSSTTLLEYDGWDTLLAL